MARAARRAIAAREECSIIPPLCRETGSAAVTTIVAVGTAPAGAALLQAALGEAGILGTTAVDRVRVDRAGPLRAWIRRSALAWAGPAGPVGPVGAPHPLEGVGHLRLAAVDADRLLLEALAPEGQLDGISLLHLDDGRSGADGLAVGGDDVGALRLRVDQHLDPRLGLLDHRRLDHHLGAGVDGGRRRRLDLGAGI